MKMIERFEKNIFYSPDGCWYWTGPLDRTKRGRISVGGVNCMAYRISYELYAGEIPNGLLVCHHCDNPMCVNPDHLFLGTHTDNMQDMWRKGRGPRRHGEVHGRAKLTDQLVLEIRRDHGNGLTPRELYVKYAKINLWTIYDVIRNRTWKHVHV